MLPREVKDGESRLSKEAEFALELLKPMVRAQKRIHEGNYNQYDPEGVYHLYMTAYDDPERAEDAQLQALQNIIERDCPTRR